MEDGKEQVDIRISVSQLTSDQVGTLSPRILVLRISVAQNCGQKLPLKAPQGFFLNEVFQALIGTHQIRNKRKHVFSGVSIVHEPTPVS